LGLRVLQIHNWGGRWRLTLGWAYGHLPWPSWTLSSLLDWSYLRKRQHHEVLQRERSNGLVPQVWTTHNCQSLGTSPIGSSLPCLWRLLGPRWVHRRWRCSWDKSCSYEGQKWRNCHLVHNLFRN
jgi:hypothetical protein